jgi:hypothetical protein
MIDSTVYDDDDSKTLLVEGPFLMAMSFTLLLVVGGHEKIRKRAVILQFFLRKKNDSTREAAC